MDLRKSIASKYVIGIALFTALIGFGAGVLANDIPFITFKTDLDLAACIAVIGLFATVFFLPYVVERRFSSIDNVNVIIKEDLESILNNVEQLKLLILVVKSGRKATQRQYADILAAFKNISPAIIDLNKELVKRNRLSGFKKEVYDEAYQTAKTACTENLITEGGLSAGEKRDAISSLNHLSAQLKCYRYNAFSER